LTIIPVADVSLQEDGDFSNSGSALEAQCGLMPGKGTVDATCICRGTMRAWNPGRGLYYLRSTPGFEFKDTWVLFVDFVARKVFGTVPRGTPFKLHTSCSVRRKILSLLGLVCLPLLVPAKRDKPGTKTGAQRL
jgi:hypothetical protein